MPKHASPTKSRSSFLAFEVLPDRDVPSDLGFQGMPDPIGSYLTSDPVLIGVPPANLPPQITSFTATETSPGAFRFAGTVADESPEGLVVYFGGAPDSVQGCMTVVQADGSFSCVIQLKTDGTDAGTVQVHTVDSGGLTSNTASVDVIPTITP